MTLAAEARAALELKYDGAIPAHLMETRTQEELQAGHHRAMIRFSETRVRDFSESLARLVSGPDFNGRAVWIERTRANIADHQADIARHQAALIPAPLAIAAE